MKNETKPVNSRETMWSIVIPAYNEARRLPRTLQAATAYMEQRAESYEILVVDDGSRDDTTAVVASFAANTHLQYGTVTPLRYDVNQGKGHAVRYGILRTCGDRVLFMDADLATPMEELEKLEAVLDSANGTEVAIGSRPLKESELVKRQPLLREMCGRMFNVVVQTLAAPGILDTQCGFKLFTRQSAQEIFRRCTLNGFSFDVESIFLARKLGYRVAEVPVRWEHQEGAAAFSTPAAYLRHGVRMVRDLLRIRRIHRAVQPVVLASDTAREAIPPSS
ncbi:MAG: glycosyltransferase family 2 protein [Armatimonadaceae bacterium]